MIPEIELKSSQEIKQFQEDELKKLLYYLKDNSTYYQSVFKRQNILYFYHKCFFPQVATSKKTLYKHILCNLK